MFEYAAKFVIGKSNGEVVAPGEYWTAINVHNPSKQSVKFTKIFAVGLPSEKPGPRTKDPINTGLGSDEAFEIDRLDIVRHLMEVGFTADFIKGFVIIKSRTELDVVAVYTATGATGMIETLHTERVPARRLAD
jgi:hypothetical protein